MRIRIWSLLLILLAFCAVISWSWYGKYLSPEPVAQQQVQHKIADEPSWVDQWKSAIANMEKMSVAEAREAPVRGPNVSSQKLMDHIKALTGERYEEEDRLQALDYITQKLTATGWVPEERPFEGGINLFAERSGTDPEAGAILLAAHYDTVLKSPGADDNASGVAVVLEAARLLRSHPTPRTLQIVFFDQEERGLRGSLDFTGNEEYLKNVRGAVILDMLSFACYKAGCQKYPSGLPVNPPTDVGDFLAVIGDVEHSPLLTAFERATQVNLPQVLTLPIPWKGLVAPDTLRSDHAPFWYKEIGAVLVTDTANLRTPHYHQPTDKIETLDQKFFVGSAQLVVNATTGLLESKGDLKQKPLGS